MSAVAWTRLSGSSDQMAQCALLDELIDQTARVADEQRTANLIALWTALTDLREGEALTERAQVVANDLKHRIDHSLGLDA